MTVRVESLQPDGWRRWRTIRSQALRLDPGAFAPSAHAWLGDTASEQQWRDEIACSGGVWLAVDEFDHDIAMVGLALDDPAQLISMWVAPQARRGGVGRRLVEVVRSAVGEATPLSLRVMAGNAPAIDFYAAAGFVVQAESLDDEGTLTMVSDASPGATTWPAPAERPLRSGGWRRGPTADQ